ncbi:ATP-grasp domain-containing protein [Nostoc sp. CENA67]|uniref:ATP-grasp domain-containing protein n=1 Tax=Amazonocrinis nigriterrae CENA67 TaxID=2794033 RepID=A0A8J7HSY7_9NOST|nr:ATP-grasp domain-containing protein [Amazonocrinis nigriterrae]MBH8563565.1 ATP-grasp domain-containing protein [Amazonocrinis nigriterrae CENA67]
MNKTGVLLLSHCGYSFMEELISNAAKHSLESFVLSSLPLPANSYRIQELQEKSAWLAVSENHALTWEDVEQVMQELAAQGYHIVCCLSVWEGYRTLMAKANQILGVADMEPAQVELLLNKYQLRQQLNQAGLSQVNSVLLDEHTWIDLQAKGKPAFIKPVTGIASYATFRLTTDKSWQDIEKIQSEIATDLIYSSIFSANRGFMAEDYIPGQEFSFEIIAVDGQPFVVAIHEKIEVDESGSAVLENACVAPPINLNESQLPKARAWIETIFQHLQLQWGCYHLEARCYNDHWEVIEINPRVGGALISPSVSILTQGVSMTQLWLNNLLYQTAEEQLQQKAQLAKFDLGTETYQQSPMSSYFRVYFAHAGRIRTIQQNICCLEPELVQVSLKSGTEVVETAREVFLGQVLWAIPQDKKNELLPKLITESRNTIQVDYE